MFMPSLIIQTCYSHILSVKKTRKNNNKQKSDFFNDVYCVFSPINNTNLVKNVVLLK